MSDKAKDYFERRDTPPLDIDTKTLFSTPKKITNVCTADIHPAHMGRYFTLDRPSRICPRCKQQLMIDWEAKRKQEINFQAEAKIDAIAERGAKPISHMTHRQKERGE